MGKFIRESSGYQIRLFWSGQAFFCHWPLARLCAGKIWGIYGEKFVKFLGGVACARAVGLGNWGQVGKRSES
jgi:hypothetical protein